MRARTRRPATRKPDPDRYKWVALSNTTVGTLMAALDGSIVIIAMPAIFRGIRLDPLAPGNITYLLWMVLGYLLVTAVLVVTLGRLGDMYGRVRTYNLGFLIFSLASVVLSLDPYTGHAGALWLILFRVVQAVGGSMLTANSAAILTDAFPPEQRGTAIGVNQVAALAGQFLGLLAGGLLVLIDWRAVFWINVPIGVAGTLWSYRSLRDNGERRPARIDWAGNITFTLGATVLLASITHGIQPYHGQPTGWANPVVLSGVGLGVALLSAFVLVESRAAEPMFRLALFRIRTFATGSLATLLVAIARGGLQFMLVIWLQGVWLPLHGYAFADTPLWAGICVLPLTAGFLLAGPLCGYLSDRYGPRLFATAGAMLIFVSFVGLVLLPVDFDYLTFAALLLLNGIGQGMFSAPNTSAIMGSIPAEHRGAASGMRTTFQNSGTALSIGVFFSLMTAGLAGSLSPVLAADLHERGVPAPIAAQVEQLPPTSTLFAAFLGDDPMRQVLETTGAGAALRPDEAAALEGTQYFPHVVAGPFHRGLSIVFLCAALMAAVAGSVSLTHRRREDGQPYQSRNASPMTSAASASDR